MTHDEILFAFAFLLGLAVGVVLQAVAPLFRLRRKPIDTAHLSGVEPADFDPRIARRSRK